MGSLWAEIFSVSVHEISLCHAVLTIEIYRVPFLSHTIFLTFLTTAFVLGAMKGNPSDYSEPLDGFRLFCEIAVFIFTIADTYLEIRDFWIN